MADETKTLAEKYNFEVKGYSFQAKKEDLRKPRIVRVSSDVNRYIYSVLSVMWTCNRLQQFKIKLWQQQQNLLTFNGMLFMQKLKTLSKRQLNPMWTFYVFRKHGVSLITTWFVLWGVSDVFNWLFSHAVCFLYARETSLVWVCRRCWKRTNHKTMQRGKVGSSFVLFIRIHKRIFSTVSTTTRYGHRFADSRKRRKSWRHHLEHCSCHIEFGTLFGQTSQKSHSEASSPGSCSSCSILK